MSDRGNLINTSAPVALSEAMQSRPPACAAPEPVTLTLPGATAYSGLSRRELYRLLRRGDIAAIKHGKRTLIVADTLRAYLASRPAARFRPLPEAAPQHEGVR